MISWVKFHFSASYLFNRSPDVNGGSLVYLSVFFIFIIIAGLLISMSLNKKEKKIPTYHELKEKIFYDSLAIGFTGILFIFFRWQQIPYFSAPILMILLLLATLAIFVYIIVFWRKTIRPTTKNISIEEQYRKYLPQNKKQSK